MLVEPQGMIYTVIGYSDIVAHDTWYAPHWAPYIYADPSGSHGYLL